MAQRVSFPDIVKAEAAGLLAEVNASYRPRAAGSLRRIALYYQTAAATGNYEAAKRYIGWEISTLASLAGLTAVATAERVRAILTKATEIALNLLAGAVVPT